MTIMRRNVTNHHPLRNQRYLRKHWPLRKQRKQRLWDQQRSKALHPRRQKQSQTSKVLHRKRQKSRQKPNRSPSVCLLLFPLPSPHDALSGVDLSGLLLQGTTSLRWAVRCVGTVSLSLFVTCFHVHVIDTYNRSCVVLFQSCNFSSPKAPLLYGPACVGLTQLVIASVPSGFFTTLCV